MSANGQVTEVRDGYRRVYTPVRGLEWNDNYFLTEFERVESTDEEDKETVQ